MKGSTYPLHLFGKTYPAYVACYALLLNLVVCVVLTWILDIANVARHQDATDDADYEDNSHVLGPLQSVPVEF